MNQKKLTSQEFHVEAPRIRILYAEQKNVGRWDFADLRTPYARLYVQQGPGAWVDFGDGRVSLSPGWFYLIPADTVFSSGSDRNVHQFYVHFTLDPEPVQQGLSSPLFSIPQDEILTGILRQVSRESRTPHQALLLEALVRLAIARSPIQLPQQGDSPRLEQARRLMRHHLRDGIRNADLAAALHMSEKGFVRWFTQESGCPPQLWLTRQRVHEASLRLHHTDSSIEEIAEAHGFCDRYHFSRVFKQHQGISPAAFRRNREFTPVR